MSQSTRRPTSDNKPTLKVYSDEQYAKETIKEFSKGNKPLKKNWNWEALRPDEIVSLSELPSEENVKKLAFRLKRDRFKIPSPFKLQMVDMVLHLCSIWPQLHRTTRQYTYEMLLTLSKPRSVFEAEAFERNKQKLGLKNCPSKNKSSDPYRSAKTVDTDEAVKTDINKKSGESGVLKDCDVNKRSIVSKSCTSNSCKSKTSEKTDYTESQSNAQDSQVAHENIENSNNCDPNAQLNSKRADIRTGNKTEVHGKSPKKYKQTQKIHSIQICNLPTSAARQDVEAVVKKFGPVKKLFLRQKDGEANGLCFVHFKFKSDADDCVTNLNGCYFENSVLNVDWS